MSLLSTLKDRHNLSDIVVIIDVFRSSNTIIEILEKGANYIVPVEHVEEAKELKSKNNDWLLFGERRGIKLPGFDGDNSPSSIGNEVKEKTIIMTTSGGTRCIQACHPDKDVVIGSFANAQAVVAYLRSKKRQDISFWAVGKKAEIDTEEDLLCAEYISNLYDGNEVDFAKIRSVLMNCRASKRLIQLDQVQDLQYCTSLSIRNVLPRRRFLSDGMPCITPITHHSL